MDYLNQAAIFHFLLYLHNKSSLWSNSKSSTPGISFSLHRLNEIDEDEEGDPIFGPTGDNLSGDPNIRGDFITEAVISYRGPRDFYCLTLENCTDSDLFPYVFYLDPSTFK
jgi:hypothetical protein